MPKPPRKSSPSPSNGTTKELNISDLYNEEYWSTRIPKYLSEDWSLRPTPFGQLATKYFSPNAKILELGCGAGQNGLAFASKGFSVVMSDASDVAFDEIKKRGTQREANFKLQQLDITSSFPFADSSFDVVFAELVLHYFNDETMHRIMGEILRILKPSGVLAVMVNSTKDIEYDSAKLNSDNLLELNGLAKRYFSLKTLAPFVAAFEPVVFDEDGRAPKDDQKGNSGMVEFIGKKK